MVRGVSGLVLGTAQLSGPYGIANRHGPPSSSELAAILDFARAAGIGMIDTAAAYGEAESALGKAPIEGFQLISKLPPDTRPGQAGAALGRSLDRLRRDSVWGLLLHRAEPTVATLELLAEMRADPRTERVGVSVYSPQQVSWLLERGAPLDVVQAPFSVFDQRFDEIGEPLVREGIELHARSAFLQGLYFLDDGDLTGELGPARESLRHLRALAARARLPLPVLLLRYVAAQPAVTRIVVGVELASQLQGNVAAMEAEVELEPLLPELRALALSDEAVLLPSHWPART